MKGYAVKRIDELEAIHGGAVKLAGAELGVESFGLQVLDFPAGFAHYPAHDHAEDGQEEVYAVLEGSCSFELAGERVDAGAGTLVAVGPGTMRRIEPGEHGVRILAVGCTPGGSYTRPDDFRLAVRS
jgi:mannose-6-phosphate isomerase-like protein (cupin superfamily)